MRRQTLVIPIALLLAVMAAAGVVLYTMNVKEEATTGGPTSTVVVASEDVPAGTELDPLIEEGKLVEQEIPKNYIVPGAVGSLEELQGRTVSQPLVEGEQILANRIDELGTVEGGSLGIPPGFTAYTVELRPEQTVANVLNRGDRVRVFATFSEKSGARASVALLPDVKVLAVSSDGDPEQQAASNQLVTLAVTPDDAAKLALFGQDTGSLWLNLLPPDAPKDQVPDPFTDVDLIALAKKS
ncbi:MAG: Flp pilus assembly protein CpaB [Actinomycetota bacterium]